MKKDQQNLVIAGVVGAGLLFWLKKKNDDKAAAAAAGVTPEQYAETQRKRRTF